MNDFGKMPGFVSDSPPRNALTPWTKAGLYNCAECHAAEHALKSSSTKNPVSPGNPCPFLRALVSEGLLDNRVASIGEATAVIEKVAATGEGEPSLPSLAIRIIALLANGLNPASLVDNGINGIKLNALRNGPFDKKGAGSRILTVRGKVSATQLARLNQFASLKIAADGSQELGLDGVDLKRMMDANFARAVKFRRVIDRALMDGEWPILLEVMGKEGRDGRYLRKRTTHPLRGPKATCTNDATARGLSTSAPINASEQARYRLRPPAVSLAGPPMKPSS